MNQVYPDLRGKVVIVTGGSRGIGAATSREFAAQGSKVGVIGRDEGAIDSVVELIRREGGHALGVVADCTDFETL
jgi:3-oxoacyl-[acyl-carrier protein] reductase